MMKLVDNPLLQFQMIIAINQDSASCGCMLMCVTKTQSNLAHLNWNPKIAKYTIWPNVYIYWTNIGAGIMTFWFFLALCHTHMLQINHISSVHVCRYTHEFISVHMSKLQSTNHQDFFLWFCVIVIVLCNFRKSDIRTLNLWDVRTMNTLNEQWEILCFYVRFCCFHFYHSFVDFPHVPMEITFSFTDTRTTVNVNWKFVIWSNSVKKASDDVPNFVCLQSSCGKQEQIKWIW